jgi:hypothetical protein
MKAIYPLFALILLAARIPMASAMTLQPATLKAWNDYIGAVDSRMQMRTNGQQPFLCSDEASGRTSLLQRGKTIVAPGPGNGILSVPGGLIHHWIGAVFIPHTSLAGLHAMLSDYDRYKDFYKPVVADSRMLPCMGTERRISMIWQHRVLFINAAIEGQYRINDVAIDPRHGYNIATTTQVREIEGYGESRQRFLAPGEGSGFIWRLHSIARYEERDGGVYLELEAIALTRDIPGSLRWLVSPLVNHLSVSSLAITLQQTRDAVYSMAGMETLVSRSTSGNRFGSVKPSIARRMIVDSLRN